MSSKHMFWICLGPLMAHGLVGGILNGESISAAGAFIGAGLFAVAIALCGDGSSSPAKTDTSVEDQPK